MPNWCTNRLTVSDKTGGADIHKFIDAITLPKDHEDEHDLTLPYPTPEILIGTRSPSQTVEQIEDMRTRRDAGEMQAGDKYVGELHENGSWVTDKYLQEQLDQIEKGEKAEKETGCNNWYDWNIEHWSTKWSPDVYSVDVDGCSATVAYQTAWAPAEKLVRQLSKLYPDLVFVEAYLEEGMGFWGANTYVGGECPHQYCGGSDAQLDALHERYSEANCSEEGEDEALMLLSDRWMELLDLAEANAIAIGEIVTS